MNTLTTVENWHAMKSSQKHRGSKFADEDLRSFERPEGKLPRRIPKRVDASRAAVQQALEEAELEEALFSHR